MHSTHTEKPLVVSDLSGGSGSLIIRPIITANPLRWGAQKSGVLQEGEGVSRDDIAAALLEVTAGRIPLDRIALRELAQEVKTWPYLDAEEKLEAETGTASNYEGITDTGIYQVGSLPLP